MSKAKFEAARELIKEKRYAEARVILKTIDHPTAQDWLERLEKLSPTASKQPLEPKAQPESKQKRRRSPWWMVVMVFGCLGITLLFVTRGGTQQSTDRNATRPVESIAQALLTDTHATEIALTPPTATSTITNTPPPSTTPIPTNTPSPIPTMAPIEFNSGSQGQQPVLGPLTLPSGIYRVTVDTNGFFIADLEANSGTCDTGIFGMFNLSRGQGVGGAGTILKSENCVALVAISNITDSWTLAFQQITSETPRITQLQFDSSTDGTQPALGPLSLPSGTYRVRVVTNGFFIAHIETLSGRCDVGIFGLFNLSAGQASRGAETILRSTNCDALIVISNVTEPWTLEFELISS